MLKADALRPQDVLVACKLHALQQSRSEWTFAGLASSVGISTGEAHNALGRCRAAQLLTPGGMIAGRQLVSLLTVAAPLVFFAARGGLAQGMPTATWAPALRAGFASASGSLPNVWPCSAEVVGLVRGEAVDPIYPTVPAAAQRDPLVYDLMALTDVMRIGGRQDREVAVRLIVKLILGRGQDAERRAAS